MWLSDDTLIKQFNSRDGQDFGVEEYGLLPDILNQPDKIVTDGKFEFYKEILGVRYVTVLKFLEETNEIFILSFRNVNEKEWKKVFLKSH